MVLPAMQQYRQNPGDSALSNLMQACRGIAVLYCRKYRCPGVEQDVLQESWQDIAESARRYSPKTEREACNLIFTVIHHNTAVKQMRRRLTRMHAIEMRDCFEAVDTVDPEANPLDSVIWNETIDTIVNKAAALLRRRRRQLIPAIRPRVERILNGHQHTEGSDIEDDVLDVAIRWASYQGDRPVAKAIYRHVIAGTL